jgi:biotin-dependent carboxylase-like uncharacterized protein
MIEVVRPGLLDLVMDLGRPGFRAQGVPEGGAADAAALVLANRLVGNVDQAAGLELLLRGPALRFPHGARLALAGAPMPARVDGQKVGVGQLIDVEPGGELELGMAETGLRTYLAVAGGIAVPPLMGSCATFLPGGFGGWQGRALKAGDVLPLGKAAAAPRAGWVPARPPQTEIRVLAGPQLGGFVDAAIKSLVTAEFVVIADANRLGLRLLGPALEYEGTELASQAVLPGAIQVPPDGQAIILGWDGPVTGGYPVMGGVIAADLPLLAQARPGERLRFRFVTPEAARLAWAEQHTYLNEAIVWQD